MLGFDVKSSFTSVPVQAAISSIDQALRDDKDFEEREGIKTSTLMEMLRVCLLSTCFKFRERHYELTDELAMGSPISPVVANIFINKIEETAISTFSPKP